MLGFWCWEARRGLQLTQGKGRKEKGWGGVLHGVKRLEDAEGAHHPPACRDKGRTKLLAWEFPMPLSGLSWRGRCVWGWGGGGKGSRPGFICSLIAIKTEDNNNKKKATGRDF